MEKKFKLIIVFILLFSLLLMFFTLFYSQKNNYNFEKESEITKKTLIFPIKVFAVSNPNVFGGFFSENEDIRVNLFLSNIVLQDFYENSYVLNSFVEFNNQSYSITLFYVNNCDISNSIFESLKSFYSEEELSKKINKKFIKENPIIISYTPINESDDFYKYYPYDYFSIKYYENISNNFISRKFILYKYKHSIFALSIIGDDFNETYNLIPAFKSLTKVEESLKSQQTFYKKYFEDEC